MDNTPIMATNNDKLVQLLELFLSDYDYDILDVDLHMLHDWLVGALSSKFYKVSTLLCYKHRVSNVGVTNFLYHFFMFVSNKINMKLANSNTGHAQEIGIILCNFLNCPIIYLVGLFY